MLEQQISTTLSSLEATNLLLPEFDLVEEKEKLTFQGMKEEATLTGIFYVLGPAMMIHDYFKYNFKYSIKDFFEDPKKWSERRKESKKQREDSKQRAKKEEQEFLERKIQEHERLVSKGLDSGEKRYLYTILETLGRRVNEAVYLAKYFNEESIEGVTENTRPDLLPVYSKIIRTNPKGEPLEIELDKDNLIQLITGQLYFTISSYSGIGINDKLGTYRDSDSDSYKLVSLDFRHKATATLVDEIYKGTENGETLKFLDVLSAKRKHDTIFLTRDELW